MPTLKKYRLGFFSFLICYSVKRFRVRAHVLTIQIKHWALWTILPYILSLNIDVISSINTKLMGLDLPPAKIRSKSYSNQLLIHFCDLIPAVRSIVAMISIQIRIQILILNLIYIKNWSIMVIIIDISRRFRYKSTIFDIYCNFDLFAIYYRLNRSISIK